MISWQIYYILLNFFLLQQPHFYPNNPKKSNRKSKIKLIIKYIAKKRSRIAPILQFAIYKSEQSDEP